MSATVELPQLFTIGEVRRRLAESGIVRSKSGLRKMELRGVVMPSRTIGQDRRLYTPADVETIKAAIREGRHPLDAA
jgi:DNA-binding transcriptional MerR regulator